jgi:hypothetical protein
METLLKDLNNFTKDCRDDMHEPDEQEITAFIVGNRFDNAHGEDIELWRIENELQELVVILRKEGKDKCFKINLASLIALARKAKI